MRRAPLQSQQVASYSSRDFEKPQKIKGSTVSRVVMRLAPETLRCCAVTWGQLGHDRNGQIIISHSSCKSRLIDLSERTRLDNVAPPGNFQVPSLIRRPNHGPGMGRIRSGHHIQETRCTLRRAGMAMVRMPSQPIHFFCVSGFNYPSSEDLHFNREAQSAGWGLWLARTDLQQMGHNAK